MTRREDRRSRARGRGWRRSAAVEPPGL